MRLYLVRHGRTANNVAGLLDTAYPGVDLDEVGRQQAQSLVGRLDGVALDALFCSDIHRAVQTITPLAAARALPVVELPGLREVPAGDQELLRDWEPYIAVMRAWGEGRLDERRPGGEDAHAFFARYDGAIAEIAATGVDAALAVSHGAALRTWLSGRVQGLSASDVARRHLGNTAIVALEGEPDAWRLVDWDPGVHHDTPHRVLPSDSDAADPASRESADAAGADPTDAAGAALAEGERRGDATTR